MDLDSRWSFGGEPNAITVAYDGWRVAQFQNGQMIILHPLPPPLDLQLLLIRERQLGASVVPEWRAENGCLYLGGMLAFEWLLDGELDPWPRQAVAFEDNVLYIYFRLVDERRCHRRTAALSKDFHSNILHLRNHKGQRFHCRHAHLVDRLLAERPECAAIQECRAWLQQLL
jgi:hypothetical protein